MGGTWIHNQQGFVWRELARYGMDRNLKLSPNEDYASRAYSMARRNGEFEEFGDGTAGDS